MGGILGACEFPLLSPTHLSIHSLMTWVITVMVAKRWLSNSLILSTFISWYSTVSEKIFFSPFFIHSLIYISVNSCYFIQQAIICYYHTSFWSQIVPDLASGSPFQLASVNFDMSSSFFQHILLSKITIFSSLSFNVPARNLRWYWQTKIWTLGVLIALGVLLFPRLLSREAKE